MSLAQSGLDDPIGFWSRKLCLLSLVQSFPDDPILHYYMLYFILIKTQKIPHINHLYAFRKEQDIKNHFHYHCHNHHHQ